MITKELINNTYHYYIFGKFLIYKRERNIEKEERRQRRKVHKELSRRKFSIDNSLTPDYIDNNAKYILVTISFNNPIIVDYQIKLIKKYIHGDYIHIICDNSNKKELAEKIRNVCISNGVSYIFINSKSCPNGFSDSHGIALNWVWKNILKEKKKGFALLDHDIVPVCNQNIEEYFNKQDFWGQVRFKNYNNHKDIWSLWPGFSFFNFDCVKDKNLNFKRYKRFGFIKVKGVDTGSANWNCLYSKYNIDKLDKCNCITWDIKNDCEYTEARTDNSEFNECVEYYNNKTWLHAINGSDWHYSNGKINLVYEILNKILNQ